MLEPDTAAARSRVLLADAAHHGREGSATGTRSEKAHKEKSEARACKTDTRKAGGSDAALQEAELQRCWFITSLLDHHDGDDDDLISRTRNDALPRAGFANLGNTCFINSVFHRIRPSLALRRQSCRPRPGALYFIRSSK